MQRKFSAQTRSKCCRRVTSTRTSLLGPFLAYTRDINIWFSLYLAVTCRGVVNYVKFCCFYMFIQVPLFELIFMPCIQSQVYKDYGMKGVCQTMCIKYRVLKYRIMPFVLDPWDHPLQKCLPKWPMPRSLLGMVLLSSSLIEYNEGNIALLLVVCAESQSC